MDLEKKGGITGPPVDLMDKGKAVLANDDLKLKESFFSNVFLRILCPSA